MPERLSGLFNSIQSQLRPSEVAVTPTDQEIMLQELHKMGFPHMTLEDLTRQQEPIPPIIPFEERCAQIQAEWKINPPKLDYVKKTGPTLAEMRQRQEEADQKAKTYFGFLLPAVALLHVGASQPT